MPLTEAQARQNLQALIDKYNKLTDHEREMTTEASVVRQFVDILLRDVLGWPIEDPRRYIYELHTDVGRPDITLVPEGKSGLIFVEAKRFGIIEELAQSRRTISGTVTPGQLPLPGMATDKRTREEQQAINYAFMNGGTWAILTNFERLRLFNARRDWLVLSFDNPGALLADFDLLWQLSYHNVVDGSLDRLSSQRHTAEVDTDYLAFINEYREKLANDVLRRIHQNRWVLNAAGEINLPLLRAVVQQYLDRLVVIRFAEDHLVLRSAAKLYDMYELRLQNEYTFSMDQFIDQFSRRFDERHNSALFAPGIVDEAVFSDDVLLPLVARLYEARYRSMPADILGNTYEQYLGKALALDGNAVTTRDNLETRKKQGSYYTPQVIVQYLVDNSLGRYLYATANGQPDGAPLEGETRKTLEGIRDLKVLDSACGSGSFLIYAYYVLAGFYESERARIEAEIKALIESLSASGKNAIDIQIEVAPLRAQLARTDDYPRLILETHLYGVDLDPQAAEIAVVNLIMRAMERRGGSQRLPLILNQNVKVGNALIGLQPDDPALLEQDVALANLVSLRHQVISTAHDDPAHAAALQALSAAIAACNAHFSDRFAPHFSDLDRIRPFHWGVEFPEVFYTPEGALKENSGFTVIIGNPPWEILKPDLREFYAQFDPLIESRLNRAQAEARIAELDAEDPARQVQYQAVSVSADQTSQFARRSGEYTRQAGGDTATHKLFLERAYSLLRESGRLGFVIPSGIYTDLNTKPLREMLLNEGNIQYLFSFSNERFFFKGVHHSFKFCLLGAEKGQQSEGFLAAFRFNPRVAVAPGDMPAFLEDTGNLMFMRHDAIEKFSPDSLSVMEFQSNYDYEITRKIYADFPLLGEVKSQTWNLRLNREFDMTIDRARFNTENIGVPLYEGKMIFQYDAFYAEPQFWISEENLKEHFQSRQATDGRFDFEFARLGFREITLATNARTLIAAIIPPNTGCNHKISVVSRRLSQYTVQEMLFCETVLNSFCMDFVARQKITSGMSMFHFYQLPVPRLTAGDPTFDALVERAARLTCTRPEYADLWHQVTGTAWTPASGITDPAQRQTLRDEIDALVAHLYGLNRDEYAHILATFPLVFPDNDIGQRRKSETLAAFDQFTPP